MQDFLRLADLGYTFCRVHRTIHVTPAMEAGMTNHVWDLTELLP